MVARTPPKQRTRMFPPLDPTLLRETVSKVDKCMARLQELQYTVSGGKKVISGVSLSPRSTRGYLRTSLRCKQESLRIKNTNHLRKSPPGKLPTKPTTGGGEWRRMSLPAMLVGETVGEILQASKFAREIVSAAAAATKTTSHTNNTRNPTNSDDDPPKTPLSVPRRKQNPENSELRARRRREKKEVNKGSPVLKRTRSRRINFKSGSSPSPLQIKENNETSRYMANRVSPRHRPWAKKAVLFPNPLFHYSSPSSKHPKFCRTKSPIITKTNYNNTNIGPKTPHKFLIKTKSPPRIKSPFLVPNSLSPSRKRSPPPKATSSSNFSKLRRSFSPSRLANRLISPLKARKGFVQKSDIGLVSGLKQRPGFTPIKFPARRI